MSYTELETAYRDLRQQSSNQQQQQGHVAATTALNLESSLEEEGNGIFPEVDAPTTMSRRPGFFLGHEGNVIAS